MEPLEGKRTGSKVGIHCRTQICASSQWVTFEIELWGSTFRGAGGRGDSKGKAKDPEDYCARDVKKKKKRVSRRKDKSTESYSAERMRKLRTKKKGGLNSSKKRKFCTVFKNIVEMEARFMKKKKGMVSQDRAETWAVSQKGLASWRRVQLPYLD